MMRKLTATGLAALAVAGVAGTGAAFAATHPPKSVAGAVSTDRSSKEMSFRDKESVDKTSQEKSAGDRSHEAHATDRSHDRGDSAR